MDTIIPRYGDSSDNKNNRERSANLKQHIKLVTFLIQYKVFGLDYVCIKACKNFIESILKDFDELLKPTRRKIRIELETLFDKEFLDKIIKETEDPLDTGVGAKVINFLQQIQKEIVVFIENYEGEANQRWIKYKQIKEALGKSKISKLFLHFIKEKKGVFM